MKPENNDRLVSSPPNETEVSSITSEEAEEMVNRLVSDEDVEFREAETPFDEGDSETTLPE